MGAKVSATVFIVDDDPAVRAAITLLVRSCGWNPIPCASGEEFLDAYQPTAPGCLLLDLHMAGMSGVELQGHLAERGIDLPVIVVTAHSDHPLADRARAAGARAILAKPFRDDDLLASIHQALTANT